jgi:hypothetical protein
MNKGRKMLSHKSRHRSTYLEDHQTLTERTLFGVMAARQSEPMLASDWSEPTVKYRSYGINIGFDVKKK